MVEENWLGSTVINEEQIYDRKKVIRITDVFGRETKEKKQTSILYLLWWHSREKDNYWINTFLRKG